VESGELLFGSVLGSECVSDNNLKDRSVVSSLGGVDVSEPLHQNVGSSDGAAQVVALVRLPQGSRPIPIAYLEYDEIERCRQLACPDYQGCLTFAAEERWKSFHCRQCPKSRPQAPESPTRPQRTPLRLIVGGLYEKGSA
jgi:hypothetical protein